MDSALPVAEEVVVVESCSPTSKFEDIFRLLSEGCFPPGFCSIKKKNLRRYAQKFVVEGNCLYYVGPKKEEKREVVVDPERRRKVFLESHFTEIGSHLGQKKTIHRIQSRYYWLGIVKDVVDWIKMCETCQNTEHSKSLSKKPQPIKVESPWDILGLDIYGPFPESCRGNTHILAVTDQYTKWVEAIPLQKRDALSVAQGLASLFYRFGASKNIYCTFSWDFSEEVTRLLQERWNISQLLTPADPTSSVSLDSQTNELLKASICNLMNEKPGEWEESLDPLLFGFRTSVSSVTKYTPFFLLYNRYACLSSEAAYAKDSSKVLRVALPSTPAACRHSVRPCRSSRTP
ncbi:hypothetical protein JRQ81_007835 [Phrynocephalus forsythii]|uniref:Gypsy retrotransposon integrase-like protein 1 n=1 Tax=Phrynocephalus forsythii TaxID=171643 RepID=A0A9Q0XFP3_9SAUR|nr:hypothetical protein JRQ81_007835 [Phrynocephalus forsythii]